MIGTKIYGQSDDNVYFEGEIKGQFSYFNSDEEFPGFLCSITDGTVLKIKYELDGIWRFFIIREGDSFDKLVQYGTAENNDPDDYSDIVYLKPGKKLKAYMGIAIELVS